MNTNNNHHPTRYKGEFTDAVIRLTGGRYRLSLALLLMAIGLISRCHRISTPPMDFHPTRQYIGASVARSYYFNMDASIPEWRRNIAQIGKDRQELLEPQILPALAAVSYRIVGGERLWIPRFYSILFWLGTGGVLLLIARDIGLNPNERLWALAVHLFTPFAILNSRIFQPDPLMLLLMFLSVWSALRYDRNPGLKPLLRTSALAAATLFVKPVCVFLLFAAFAALLLHRIGLRKAATNPHLYVFTALMLTPAVAYYVIQLKSGGFIGQQTQGSFLPGLWLTGKYWFGWLKMIGRNIGLQGLAAAAIGFTLLPNPRARWFLGGLWFGYLCYGLFFNYHIHTHDYYSMMLIPMAALSAAPFLARIPAWLAGQWRMKRGRLLGAATGAAVVAAVSGALLIKMAAAGRLTPTHKSLIKTAGSLAGADMKLLLFLGRGIDEAAETRAYEEIGELAGHTDKALYLTHDHGKSLIYHAEIAGEAWPGQTDFAKRKLEGKPPLNLPALLAKWINQDGMQFFVATDLDEFRKQPELIEILDLNHALISSKERYRVYQLGSAAGTGH